LIGAFLNLLEQNCLISCILQLEVPSETEEDEEDPDGRYAFKRKKGVKYLPVSNQHILELMVSK